MTRMIRMQLRLVVTAMALVALVAAPAAVADLAVQHDSTVVTETAGNGNGVPEPGDTVAVTENVVSFDDTQTLMGVTGTLSTSNADTTIPSPVSPYSDLMFGWPTGNTTPFSVQLGSTMECGVNVPLTLSLQTSGGTGGVPFNLPTGKAGAYASYDSTDVPRSIPDGDSLGLWSTLTIGGSGRVKGLKVRIGQITHTYDGDLTITLIAPDGRSVVLVNQKGGNGDNFVNTVLDDNATASLGTAVAPFTGSYRPAEPLSYLDGSPLAGSWTLRVVDGSPGEIGTLDAWGLDAAPAVCDPQPAPTPPPSSDPPPTPPPPPHDCGQHNGTTTTSGKGNAKPPSKDKPCKN
jgi:subtilisin-like proprotein convertase family protein